MAEKLLVYLERPGIDLSIAFWIIDLVCWRQLRRSPTAGETVFMCRLLRHGDEYTVVKADIFVSHEFFLEQTADGFRFALSWVARCTKYGTRK